MSIFYSCISNVKCERLITAPVLFLLISMEMAPHAFPPCIFTNSHLAQASSFLGKFFILLSMCPLSPLFASCPSFYFPPFFQRIEGEVYRVDGQMLRFLDDFEGVPQGYYDRIEIPVELLNSNGEEQEPLYFNASDKSGSFSASAYFLREFKQELLQLPFIQNYDSYGPHGLPYEERFDRSAKEEADNAIPEVKVSK